MSSVSFLCLSPSFRMWERMKGSTIVATITKRKCIQDLGLVIEAGYLSELVSLDLQCGRQC